MTTYEDETEKRLKTLEQVCTCIYIRMSDLDGKLNECLEMIRALEGKGDAASAIFRKLYPKTIPGVPDPDDPRDAEPAAKNPET